MSGQSREWSSIGVRIIPENLALRKLKVLAFGNGGAMRAPLRRV